MSDIENLLRETLTDSRRQLAPSPDLYDFVSSRARSRRRRRRAAGLSVAAAVTIVGAVAVVGELPSHAGRPTKIIPDSTSSAAARAASSPAAGTIGGTLAPASGQAESVVTAGGQTWAVYTDPAGSPSLVPVAGTPATDSAVAATPGSGVDLAIDLASQLVWTWASTGDSGAVTMYDSTKDTDSTGVSWDSGAISGAAAVGGDLWLTTDTGLYRIQGKHGLLVTKIGSVGRAVFGIAADPAKARLLVGVQEPSSSGDGALQVEAIDESSGAVRAKGESLALGKASLAVVDGQVWVAGYGSGDSLRIVHLDAQTLDQIGTSVVNANVGPGSQVWAGQHVVWVRDGGDEQLACVDPIDGRVLEAWPSDVQGPVTSTTGVAYAVSNGVLETLTLSGGCPG